MACAYQEYAPEAVGATAVALHVALGISVLGLLITVPFILYCRANTISDRIKSGIKWGIVAIAVLWVATFMTWTFANPGFVGPPIVLRSVARGPYFGETLIPWASNAVVTPGKIVRACSREEAIAAVDAEPNSVRVVGSGHSFSALYEAPGTSLYLNWCNEPQLLDDVDVEEVKVVGEHWGTEIMEIEVTKVIRIDAGCKISTLVNFAGSHGLEVHGTGSIQLQTVGGGIGTDLHGADPWGFARYLHKLEVYTGEGTTDTVEGPDVLKWWSAIGQRGIVLSADIHVSKATTVVRTITNRLSWADVIDTVKRAADTDDKGVVGVMAHITTSNFDRNAWSVAKFTDPEKTTAVPGRVEPQGSAWTYAFDNIVIALTTVAPWIATAAPGGDAAFLSRPDGRMPWAHAQLHVVASVAATGEVAVAMENCDLAVRAIIDAATKNDVGPVDILVRPRSPLPVYFKTQNDGEWPARWAEVAESDGACWIDYGLLPPMSAGTTVKFHEDAARYLTPLGAVPHSGKMWAGAAPPAIEGADSKFRWRAKQEYVGTVDPDSYKVLDARRLAWIGLLITTWIVAAAVAFAPLAETASKLVNSNGYLSIPQFSEFV